MNSIDTQHGTPSTLAFFKDVADEPQMILCFGSIGPESFDERFIRNAPGIESVVIEVP